MASDKPKKEKKEKKEKKSKKEKEDKAERKSKKEKEPRTDAEENGTSTKKSKKAATESPGTRKSPRLAAKLAVSSMPQLNLGQKRKADDDDNVISTKRAKTFEEDNYPFDDFPDLKEDVRLKLVERGITFLFPIQAMTFNAVYAGADLIGRARTGSGKTLAFVLPVICKLFDTKDQWIRSKKPQALVVSPTRELSIQISKDFESVAGSINTHCFYGGSPYDSQNAILRQGCTVVIGTPGRIIDHIERGTMDVSQVKYVVLDEADEMLSMGFKDSMEKILGAVPPLGERQTLLFSATMPGWVKEITRTCLKKDATTVDLVKDQVNKTATNISHLAMACPYFLRPSALGDVVKIYAGSHGRAIVFCDKKQEANELAQHEEVKADCQVLHGDIPQKQRELTLAGFRDGKFRCLVATDVAARGLDIPNVDLVVQCHPPTDQQAYVHRAGRTARAGNVGVCITFFTAKESDTVKWLEHKTGITMKRIGAPQPIDILKAAARDCKESLDGIDEDVTKYFLDTAKLVINERGAENALAAALAHISGYAAGMKMKTRSLLSAFEGFCAMWMKSEMGFNSTGHAWSMLRRVFNQDDLGQVKGMALSTDGKTAIFDVPENLVKKMDGADLGVRGLVLEVATELPEIQGRGSSDIRDIENNIRAQKSHWRDIRSGGRGSPRGGRGGARGSPRGGRGGFRGGRGRG